MRRIRLDIEYDGTNYAGWQRQENALSIQQVLEQELRKITKEDISLVGAGRTDSGVHALCQSAHFDTGVRMDAAKFAFALNAGLPRDIRVHRSCEAPPEFHARFSAKSKHYRYTLRLDTHASALYHRYELHMHEPLDIEAMARAAATVPGEHDFASFMAAGSTVSDTVRSVYRSEWTREGPRLVYDIEGNGFLYHMVRILVGTFIEIGQGRRSGLALEAKDRAKAGPTAPAHGLTLVSVEYQEAEIRR